MVINLEVPASNHSMESGTYFVATANTYIEVVNLDIKVASSDRLANVADELDNLFTFAAPSNFANLSPFTTIRLMAIE